MSAQKKPPISMRPIIKGWLKGTKVPIEAKKIKTKASPASPTRMVLLFPNLAPIKPAGIENTKNDNAKKPKISDASETSSPRNCTQ